MGLDGKTLLITGAARGIGAAIAHKAADAGARAIVHSRKGGAAAAAVVARFGAGRAVALAEDLCTPGAGMRLWERARAWAGPIDVLVNNAGIFEPVELGESDGAWQAAWARHMQINLAAPADLCRAAIADFRSRGGGIIINVASRAAHRGDDPAYLPYAASKAGLVALTKSIARGFAADGVLAYALAPGFVRTDMAEDYIRRFGEARAADGIPLGSLAPAEEIAALAVFLASGAVRHATGATFDINGGSYVR